MKVLEKGTGQEGWSTKARCTGAGNGMGGCGALLLIEQKDLYHTHHYDYMPEKHYGEDLIITRKGAINAESGKLGLIPGSMGSKSYVVRGKGCEESYNSAPHGAGRKMSRSKAKAKYSLSDAEATMKGIVCTLEKSMVDEIKYAYKNIEDVMQHASELVEPIHELTQVINVKG